MSGKIAEAQHFSDVIHQASSEPQIILNRNRTVAAVIAADELVFRADKPMHTEAQRAALA